jgi:hypothetical protein
MAVWVVQFSNKILERFLPKNQLSQCKLLNMGKFGYWEGVKKCQNLTLKVNLLHQKLSKFFKKNFKLKNINLEHIFVIVIF